MSAGCRGGGRITEPRWSPCCVGLATVDVGAYSPSGEVPFGRSSVAAEERVPDGTDEKDGAAGTTFARGGRDVIENAAGPTVAPSASTAVNTNESSCTEPPVDAYDSRPCTTSSDVKLAPTDSPAPESLSVPYCGMATTW